VRFNILLIREVSFSCARDRLPFLRRTSPGQFYSSSVLRQTIDKDKISLALDTWKRFVDLNRRQLAFLKITH
jgi:DNA primase catalytic subunit